MLFKIILFLLLPLIINTTQIFKPKNQILNEYLNNVTLVNNDLQIANITNTKFELDSIYLADYYCHNNELSIIYLNSNNLKQFSFKSKYNDSSYEVECLFYKNIKILSLSNNKLEQLDRDNLIINQNEYPFKIEVLLLQSNNLEYINKQIFKYLFNLKYLDLSNN
jgi:Leucine-rich repeat (LRR) protein